MGKSSRNYRERARRIDERSDSMSPYPEKSDSMRSNFEPEKIDDIMDIYTDANPSDPFAEHYQWEDEDDDDI
jgi:hypothetical protein